MWTTPRTAEFLADGHWFSSLPHDLQQKIIQSSEVVKRRRNSLLYGIGDPVDGMYAVLEGDLRAYVYDDRGCEIFLRSFGPKTWFGDLHLHDQSESRTFEVRSVSASTLLFLPKQAWKTITTQDHVAYQHFVRLLCFHLRFLTRIAIESRSDAPLRTARALIRLAKSQGIPVESGVQLKVRISQSDLASLVGVTRQYINGLLTRWNKEGVLTWKGTSPPVLNIEKLQSMLTPLDEWMPESEIDVDAPVRSDERRLSN